MHRWIDSLLCAIVAWGLQAACAALPRVVLTEVVDGLKLPVAMASAPDASNRLFVVEQRGVIRVVEDGKLLPKPFLDISGKVALDFERGLLGLAFHPDYARNGAFYVYYTVAHTGDIAIARYLRDGDHPDRADAGSAEVLLQIGHREYASDNGGQLAFGRDGDLYIATGDGGGGNDKLRHAQDLGSRLGKILRIAVDGGRDYTIPADNPYAHGSCGSGKCPEVYDYGLRNPWRFSFDRATGDLYIGDVGEDKWEEVDYVPAGSRGGLNFGWGVYEGAECLDDRHFGAPGACAALKDAVRPLLTYGHGRDGGHAIVGGFVYRGKRIPALAGHYVYADYASRRIWHAWREAGRWHNAVLLEPPPQVKAISSFGEGRAGELYLLDLGNGKMLRIDPRP